MADNFLNKTGLQYYHNRIKQLFATKTEVNDLEDRIDDIVAEGGEPNVITEVQVNGTALPVNNKAVNVTVPTATSALTNDSGYQTATEVQSAIDSALEDITGVDFQVVTTLPATGEAGTIYLVSNSGTGQNIYDEYIYTNNAWEKIGSTDVDLTQYWAKTELVAITTAEIDTITG